MAKTALAELNNEGNNKQMLICGIVMPISAIDTCDAEHWVQVKDVIEDAISDAGFKPNLVSNSEGTRVIHATIVQNLYNNPIAVIDVSCKNPNVMFELGMRLAFDKPTVVIKDDATDYTFDAGGIDHLQYSRSLKPTEVKDFRKRLKDKIRSTYDASESSPTYTTFLKHFQNLTPKKMETVEVSQAEYNQKQLMLEISELKSLVSTMFNRADVVEYDRETPAEIVPAIDVLQEFRLPGFDRQKMKKLVYIIHNRMTQVRVIQEGTKDGILFLIIGFTGNYARRYQNLKRIHELIMNFEENPESLGSVDN